MSTPFNISNTIQVVYSWKRPIDKTLQMSISIEFYSVAFKLIWNQLNTIYECKIHFKLYTYKWIKQFDIFLSHRKSGVYILANTLYSKWKNTHSFQFAISANIFQVIWNSGQTHKYAAENVYTEVNWIVFVLFCFFVGGYISLCICNGNIGVYWTVYIGLIEVIIHPIVSVYTFAITIPHSIENNGSFTHCKVYN